MLVPLVVIHELGHFLVCKLGGIRVTQFAFGFGQKLFGFRYGDTEYRWNLLPLGGYVDFMGEAVYTGRIPRDAAHFYRRPKWLRFLVLVMGPLFNLILAFILLFLVFWMRPAFRPIFNEPLYTVGGVLADSPEAKAGLTAGDRIIAYNGTPVESSGDMLEHIALHPERHIELTIVRDGQEQSITYTIAENQRDGIGMMNFVQRSRVQVSQVGEGTPAAKGGLQENDIVVAINQTPIHYGIPGQTTFQEWPIVAAARKTKRYRHPSNL